MFPLLKPPWCVDSKKHRIAKLGDEVYISPFYGGPDDFDGVILTDDRPPD